EGLGAFGELTGRFGGPHAVGVAVVFGLDVLAVVRHGADGVFAVVAQHREPGRDGWFPLHPYVAPDAVVAAPLRAELTAVLGMALGEHLESVDPGLDRPLLAARRVVVLAADQVDLPGEGIQADPLRDVQEHLLVTGWRLVDTDLGESGALRRGPVE